MDVMRSNARFLALAVLALAFLPELAQPANADSLSVIKTRGTLNVGVKADVIGFSYLDPKTEQYEGYEIDIARELAKRLLADPSKVSFTSVTPSTRGTLLDSRAVDMLVATFSITPE